MNVDRKTSAKERLELSLVEELCEKIHLHTDPYSLNPLGDNDPPDVEIIGKDFICGIECTRYRATTDKSDITVGYKHQSRREEFFDYLQSFDVYRKTGYYIESLYFLKRVGERVVLPSKNMFSVLCDELVKLINTRNPENCLGGELLITRVEIMHAGFPTLREYVNTFRLSKTSPIIVGHSEITFRVDFSDEMLVEIVNDKNAKIINEKKQNPEKFKRYDSLWLLIHEGEFDALMASSLVLEQYIPSNFASSVIASSPFDRIYVRALGRYFMLRTGTVPLSLKK